MNINVGGEKFFRKKVSLPLSFHKTYIKKGGVGFVL